MDTSDLLMSSQQQVAGAERRRPGGFQIRDLGCPDGVSVHSHSWKIKEFSSSALKQ